jgi:branched-chain amino acid aminotransferase
MTQCGLGSRVWINGVMVEAEQAFVPFNDRGFTLGDGLFETMLWTGSEVRFLDDHMIRLSSSADETGIEIPEKHHDILDALKSLGAQSAGAKAVLRVTLTRGSGPRGLAISETKTPVLIASGSPFQAHCTPVTLTTVSITRHSGAPSARLKTLSYIDNIMALHQARAMGSGDAIMLGTNRNVACASSANLVINYKGASLTPAVEDGALPGIVRGRLIKAGLVEEANITQNMLANSTCAALTNALIGARSISQIDGQEIEVSDNWLKPFNDALDA